MEPSRQTNQPTDGHKEGHLGSLTSIEQEEKEMELNWLVILKDYFFMEGE